MKDPEIPVNIYDLGLIYTIDCAPSGDVHIEMSLTARVVQWQARCRNRQCGRCAGNSWPSIGNAGLASRRTPERMSEDAKLALDFGF